MILSNRIDLILSLHEVTLQTSQNKGSLWIVWKTFSQQELVVIKAQRRIHVINFQMLICLLLMLAENSFPVTVNQTWLLFWKLGYFIITIIEGQALVHTVCRKTKSNSVDGFAYNFTEATSRNIESRKDVCTQKNTNDPPCELNYNSWIHAKYLVPIEGQSHPVALAAYHSF